MLDFIRTVLPQSGPFCVAFRSKERKGWIHRAVKDHLAVAKTAAWGASKGWDTYFCISSLKNFSWVDPQGKEHKRKKENCAKTQVLVLDVDVDAKNDKKYANKQEALKALEIFNQALDFAPPIIVDSGYGLHAYWLISKPLESAKWEALAGYFKGVALKLDPKLAADTSRMADSAGVLRLPGTRNYKNEDEPQSVSLLQFTEVTQTVKEISEKLFAKGKELGVVNEAKKKYTVDSGIDLGMDVPHRIKPIIKKCNWLQEYLKNIATATEPEWYAVLGLVKHCYHPKKTTSELAHMFSRGHPGYSVEETLNKFNQVSMAQTGPSLCSRYRGLNPKRCEGCKYAQLVNTPVRLDEVDLPDTVPIKIELEYKGLNGHAAKFVEDAVPMPTPYFRGQQGGIYINLDGGSMEEPDESSKAVKQIYEYDIFPISRLQNEDNGEEEIEVLLRLPQDGQRIIRVPNEVTIEPKRFASYLTARGVLLKQHQIIPLINYMIDYTRAIQRVAPAKGVYTRFGWRDAQTDHPMFVLGDGVITTEGAFVPGNTASWLSDLKHFAGATGDIHEWRKAFEVNLQHSIPPYQFAMMLGFAAPLFALTPYHGMMFNLLGRGGIGKSTALKFMTSIWGKPTFTHVLKKDNSIPMFNKVGYLNSIPVAYDEITELPADQTADLAYSITEGRGKERADRNGNTRINFVKWSTVLVSCSNLSLYEKIGLAKKGNAAPAYRIFEVDVDEFVEEKNKILIEDAIRVLDGNHGVAGRLFMQHVVRNNLEISRLLVQEEERISKEFQLKTIERFWGGMFATVSVSMDICRALGLHNFDKEKMLEWALSELRTTRKNLKESQGNALNTLSDFINSNLHATLFVTDGRPNAYGAYTSPTRELHIRLERSGTKFTEGYISTIALKKYCLANKIEYGWVTKELQAYGAIKPGSMAKRLGSGTEFSGVPVSCLLLDFTCPLLTEDMIPEIPLVEKTQ